MIFQYRDILERIGQRPFTPFRLHTSSGRVHEIRHPELVFANPSFVFVGIPMADDDLHAVQEFVRVALAHITEIEPTGGPTVSATENGNGNGLGV